MSGPKDYTFAFDAERLAVIRQVIAEQGRRRAQVVAEDLAAARVRSTATLDQIRRKHATADQATSAALRKQAAQQRAQALRTSSANEPRTAEDDEVREGPASVAEQAPTSPLREMGVPDTYEQEAEATRDAFQRLLGWQKTLAADADIRTFRREAHAKWALESDAMIARIEAHEIAGATELQGLLRIAQRLYEEAGDLSARFHTRNLLLRDVIDSMKSIGFFVADPFFEVPDDPSGAVILKATMGSETMSASIDLSDTIRSVWNGVEQEACKDVFFKYVDAMKSRGVAVQAERPDLRGRPVLKQRGANELPNSQQRSN